MSENKMVFKVELGKHSAAGLNRPQNDDNVGYYLPPQPEVLNLRGQMFILAGGESNDRQGYIASKMVVETLLQDYYDAPWSGIPQEMIARSIEKANKKLLDYNIEQGGVSRFTSSVVCVVIINEMLYMAHVGTPRVYLLNNEQTIELLTRDGAGEAEAAYQFSPQPEFGEQTKMPGQALGVDEQLHVEVSTRKIQVNDVVFLCSQGVYTSLQDSEIFEILNTDSPQDASEAVVKRALDYQTQQDATALTVKMKSIRRIAGVEEDEEEDVPEEIPQKPSERNIVIKGVRYRSTWKDDQLPAPETESVEEFDQDRDVRRRVVKRKSPGGKFKLPGKNTLNLFAFIVLIAAIIFLIIKYGPGLWRTDAPESQSMSEPDSLVSAPVIEPDTVAESQEIAIQPPPIQNETEELPIEEIEVANVPDISLKVAVVNGSFSRNIRLGTVVERVSEISSEDQITSLRSTIRLPGTKIIWRRTNDAARAAAIQARVDSYKNMLFEKYQLDVSTFPLDFTLVIGANFKLPNLSRDKGVFDAGEEYYLEILNGSTASGMARRLSELLDNRVFDGNLLHIIDFRNADKKNYRATFLKCAEAQNDVAAQLINAMKLPNYVINDPLFDVKLLIGADID